MAMRTMTAHELVAQPDEWWARVVAGELRVLWWNKQPEPHNITVTHVEEGANDHWVIVDGIVEGEFSDTLPSTEKFTVIERPTTHNALPLKLSAQEFGETCHLIMDAFERGEPDVPTALAIKLVGHVEAMLKEDAQSPANGLMDLISTLPDKEPEWESVTYQDSYAYGYASARWDMRQQLEALVKGK